ncbi:hypothetical protein [Methanobrevibacter millerae]|uniref:Uncharacterized protein n=1 Tax=Methanobrevibacter millerae TaxID=230361 RepID=A0A1G5VB13_9EURY|nr:hypothetical protein [Methanobrevibacter millerae]SDA43004.1 hypothetical protein SAMN02910315_00493 [Methanobrevibacter millerae]
MFKEIFGNCPQVKVIDYMISTPFSQHTKQQIAVGAEISRSTLNNFIDELVDIEIITCKNSKFSLNSKSNIVKGLMAISEEFVEIEYQKQIKLPDEISDELTIEEEELYLSESAPNVNLDALEQEINIKENYTFSSINTNKLINFEFMLMDEK